MHWTAGILWHFRAFSTPKKNPAPEVLSTPAPPPSNANRWAAYLATKQTTHQYNSVNRNGQSMRFSQKRVLKILLTVSALVGATLACGKPDTRPPLKFNPDKLPDAQVGQLYEVIIEVTDNQTPVFQMTIVEGNLPEGLTLDFDSSTDDGAKLSGTPFEKGEYVFTIRASCYGTMYSGQTGEYKYTLLVK